MLRQQVYHLKAELTAKNNMADHGEEGVKSDHFQLQQTIENLKHQLTLERNENTRIKSDLDSYRLKNTQLSMALESKERAYNELALQSKDLQLHLERNRRSSTSDYLGPMLEYKFNPSIYSSPYKDLGNLTNFNSTGSNLSRIFKSPMDLSDNKYTMCLIS